MLSWCLSLVLAVPLFVEDTARLGTQPDCGGNPGCWTNYTVLVDLDGADGLDVLFPNADGFFAQGPAQPFVVLANDGSGNFTDVSASVVGGYTGWLRQVAVGDIDGDGDPDLIAPDAWGGDINVYVNDGSGGFDEQGASLIGATSHAGSARLADVDDDGDLDLMLGEWVAGNEAHLYLNDGAGAFTEAPGQIPAIGSIGNADLIDMDFFDADGDFDLDVVFNTHAEDAVFWLNDGQGTFSASAVPLPAHTDGFTYDSSACDVDGDGDLDLWNDNARGPQRFEQLIINDGSGVFTDETTDRVSGNPGADDNGVLCADVDGDGDFDAVIPSLSNNERVLINDGAGNFAASSDAFPLVSDGTLWMGLGDVDGDGRLDVVTGQGESTFLNRLYLGNGNVPVDDRPPAFRQVELLGTVPVDTPAVLHFAVSDQVVTDLGPRLQSASVEVGGQSVPATFMGGDLFRAELPAVSVESEVSYRACATDVAGNSGCSASHNYTVSGDPGPTPTPTPNPGEPGGGPGGCHCQAARASGHPAGRVAILAVLLAGGLWIERRRLR